MFVLSGSPAQIGSLIRIQPFLYFAWKWDLFINTSEFLNSLRKKMGIGKTIPEFDVEKILNPYKYLSFKYIID